MMNNISYFIQGDEESELDVEYVSSEEVIFKMMTLSKKRIAIHQCTLIYCNEQKIYQNTLKLCLQKLSYLIIKVIGRKALYMIFHRMKK